MPRTKIVRRKADRLKADIDEKLRLAQIKIDSVLETVDEMEKRAKQEVDHKIKVILSRTDKKILDMKLTDFLSHPLDHFEDYQFLAPMAPTSRSLSIGRLRLRTPRTQSQRDQAQSVDRMKTRSRTMKDISMTFQRWPRPGERVLSTSGSPLAVQAHAELHADVHIPTRKGVITVKPHKIKNIEREVLMEMDQNTLNQVKTLNDNLEMIVDMATKMGRL
ncbi:uncharacterized protein Dana_GF22049 [Drosophila ananassae]|uniref:Borealin C-terminal domain-containing protein n=1 Tax=Drosophila ananassae TaxID=7217 RepID=B3MUS9_DROAN|nr:borealin [Drosophila ananassae]EDV32994.1 uncharacterized protein Dana_GF22049 [Drosophila ananassae]